MAARRSGQSGRLADGHGPAAGDRRDPPPGRPAGPSTPCWRRPGESTRHRPRRIDDDVLALMFVGCHPVLSPEARVALTLRVVGGLSSEEIARAFLVPVPTVAARIPGPSRRSRRPGCRSSCRAAGERHERLAACSGPLPDLHRGSRPRRATGCCAPTVRRGDPAGPHAGRAAAGRAGGARPARAVELPASRFPARTGPDGSPVLLEDQDRPRWDRSADPPWAGRAGQASTRRPRPVHPAGRDRRAATRGPARSRRPTGTGSWRSTRRSARSRPHRWSSSTGPSRCCTPTARGRAGGARPIRDDPRLARYHLFGAVRADVLSRLGRTDEAAEELEPAPRPWRRRGGNGTC